MAQRQQSPLEVADQELSSRKFGDVVYDENDKTVSGARYVYRFKHCFPDEDGNVTHYPVRTVHRLNSNDESVETEDPRFCDKSFDHRWDTDEGSNHVGNDDESIESDKSEGDIMAESDNTLTENSEDDVSVNSRSQR